MPRACQLLLFAAAASAFHVPHNVALQRPVPSAARAQLVASEATGPAPSVAKAYTVAGLATAAAWSSCALVALSTHPNAAINAACGLRHNVLTIGQALALPLPLAWAVVTSLNSAATVGWERLSSATYRRLNLALAAASVWMAAAAAYMPAFTGLNRYDMYPLPLKVGATAAHAATAVLCLGVWGRTVKSSPVPLSGHYVPRIVRGFVGSVMNLAPKQGSDDPDAEAGGDGRAEYALAALLFGYFAVLPVMHAQMELEPGPV